MTDEKNILKAHQEGSTGIKRMLETLFPTAFKKEFRMEDLESFEDCCEVTGDDPDKAYSDYDRLCIIIKAINNNVEPDWDDSNEPKYYIWWDVVKDKSKPSGFGLSFVAVYFTLTHTDVASRLTFRSRKGAEYAKKFVAYYEAVYLK